jgi:serine/threonine-protein kinase
MMAAGEPGEVAPWAFGGSVRQARDELEATTLEDDKTWADSGPISGERTVPNEDSALTEFSLERERFIARAEHAALAHRLREAIRVGVVVWPATGLLDYWVVRCLHAGSLAYFWGLRALALGPGLFVLWRLSRSPLPGRAMLKLLDVFVFTLPSVMVSLMCLEFGGIASPYATGLAVILVARGAAMFERLRVGAWTFGIPALSFPLVVLVASVFDTRIRAELADAHDLALFVTQLVFLTTTWLLLTVGGDAAFKLRRQALETRNVNRYRLLERLGVGGMGEVWEARDVTLGYRVAIKLLRSTRQDASSVLRFSREVRALAGLKHPNTVRVLDWGVTEDALWYYAMELLHGANLYAVVVREGALPPTRVLLLARQMLGALGEAHGKGIVHRDIKPHNVFVARSGAEQQSFVLLDFGVAKLVMSDDASLTRADCAPGTPGYMAPEVLAGGNADARSDLYSLGVTLHFALTGELGARSIGANVSARAASTPIPAGLRALIDGCLARDPGERFQSATAALQALAASEPN